MESDIVSVIKGSQRIININPNIVILCQFIRLCRPVDVVMETVMFTIFISHFYSWAHFDNYFTIY